MAASVAKIVDSASFAAATKVSRETLERLNLYESLLRVWQKRINLVANATLEELWGRHFFDSAQLLPLIPAEARSFVDLGSGGGFPGLVLAIMMADLDRSGERSDGGVAAGAANVRSERVRRVVLVESDQRKGAFLREVARQCGVAVEILSARIENPETQVRLGQVDCVTARALAPLDRLLGLAAPLFGERTVGLFLKGQSATAEVEAARATWAFDVSVVPSATAADASVLVIRRPSRR